MVYMATLHTVCNGCDEGTFACIFEGPRRRWVWRKDEQMSVTMVTPQFYCKMNNLNISCLFSKFLF